MRISNLMAFGGLMACLAALLQLTPVLLTEMFVLITMLSALPIYLISRIHPKLGLMASLAAFFIISIISVHEGLFFLLTNGPVGCSLGFGSHYFKKKINIIIFSSFILAVGLCIMNFFIGIPVFGFPMTGFIEIQLLGILIFSFVYNLLYLKICNFIYDRFVRIEEKMHE